jgi:hypothetical protein
MGLLSGFIGGAAKAASGALEAGMAEDAYNRKRELDETAARGRIDYAAQVELNKQEFLERLRLQREKAAQESLMAQGEQIVDRGTQIVKDRDTSTLDPFRKNMAGWSNCPKRSVQNLRRVDSCPSAQQPG